MSIRRLCLSAALILPLLPLSQSGAAAEPTPDVPLIHNPAQPLDGERTLQLEELWRVDIEDEEQLIGVIADAVAGPDSTVWLADQQLGCVFVYSADGRYLHTFSGQGEGPGEVTWPRELSWLPGGELGIRDRKQGQITALHVDGTPASSVHLQTAAGEPMAGAQLAQLQCRGGTLALCGTIYDFSDGPPVQNRFFSIFATDGREVARLMTAPSGFDFGARTYDELANYFVDRGAWTIDRQGRIYHAPHYDRYLIEVHDAEGRLVRVIEREYEPRKRTEEDKQGVRDGTSMSINGERVQLDCDLQDHDAAIDNLHTGPDGRIWVVNGSQRRDLPDGVRAVYDVFDTTGRFREVVRVACSIDGGQDRLIRLDDGRWIALLNLYAAQSAMWAAFRNEDEEPQADEEAEPLRIVCLREAYR